VHLALVLSGKATVSAGGPESVVCQGRALAGRRNGIVVRDLHQPWPGDLDEVRDWLGRDQLDRWTSRHSSGGVLLRLLFPGL